MTFSEAGLFRGSTLSAVPLRTINLQERLFGINLGTVYPSTYIHDAEPKAKPALHNRLQSVQSRTK